MNKTLKEFNKFVDKSIKFIDDLVIDCKNDETVFENKLFIDFIDKCFDYVNIKELSYPNDKNN